MNTVANLVVEFLGQMGDYYLFKNCVPWTSFIQDVFFFCLADKRRSDTRPAVRRGEV